MLFTERLQLIMMPPPRIAPSGASRDQGPTMSGTDCVRKADGRTRLWRSAAAPCSAVAPPILGFVNQAETLVPFRDGFIREALKELVTRIGTNNDPGNLRVEQEVCALGWHR